MKALTALLAFLLVSCCGLVAHAHGDATELPDIGSSTSKVLSERMEQLIGDDYMRQLRQFAPIIDDPEVVAYINDLGFKLVAATPSAMGREFYFFVINDPQLNAFAMPGGYIGVHSELMLMAENESELAGVLAHEISHVTQRHLARRLERAKQLSFPTLAAILGGIILAAGNPQAGIAAATAAQAGAQQILINHTRDNEAEADRIGMQTMAAVDLDPNGMASFFEKMEQTYRYLRLPPPVLLTHPVTQQRIADARLRAAELQPRMVAESLSFRLMQARVRDLTQSDLNLREKQLQVRLKGAPDSAVLAYELALLRARQGDPQKSLEIAEALIKQDPRQISYPLLKARTLTALRRYDDAEQLLSGLLALHPRHHALTLAYADVLMLNNKAAEARKHLLAYVSLPDTEPSVYQMLAAAQEAAGYKDEVHESQGLYLQAVGDLPGAIQQFELARRARSDDPYADTRVNARIRHLQDILLERRKRR